MLRAAGLLLAVGLVGCGDPEPLPSPPVAAEPATSHADEFRHLPDMGPISDYMRRQDRRIDIDRGYYTGTWRARGPGYLKRGAGARETVIDGDLEIEGSGWIISKATVTGDVLIQGDDNDVSGLDVWGKVQVRGVGNKD